MDALPSRIPALALAAGLALAAALGGCGDSSTSTSSTSATQAPTLGAELAKAFPVPISVAWQQVDAGSDGKAVVVQAVDPDLPCVAYQTRVRESSQQVQITLLKDASGCAGDATPQTKAPPKLRVQLEHQLDGREVIGSGPNNDPAESGLTAQ